MTSLRKIEANRKNALASTGPKSNKGKQRSGRNARRHGLAVPIGVDPGANAEVANRPTRKAMELLSVPPSPGKLAFIIADLADTFRAMDRYERRAQSRRKFAIRDLDGRRFKLRT